MRSSSRTTSVTLPSSRSFSTANASSSAGSTQPRSSPASISVRALSVSSSSVSWLWVKSESMSFRFCERHLRPACLRARVPPLRTRDDARPFHPGSLIMDGLASQMLNRGVPTWLRLLAARAFLHRAARPAGGEQLGGPLRRDRLHRAPGPQAGVRLPVRDVGPEPAFLEDDRLAADRVVAELLERGRGCAAAALARLGPPGERLLERDREELLLRVDRARLVALLDVGPVAAVRGDDFLAVGFAERPRQRQEPDGVLERDRLRRHRLEERRGARLVVALDDFRHVRAVAARLDDDRAPRRRVDTELLLLPALREELLGALGRQLVGRHLGRQRLPLVAALEVRAVLPDPHDDVAAGELDRVDLARINLAEASLDELLQAGVAVGAEVEAAQPLVALLLAGGDLVEVVLHARGELVVDELREVLLEQVDDREREELRHERLALLPHVAAVEDRPHDRRVRRRPADAALLERLHERRLREAGGRRRRAALRLERGRVQRVALGELREQALLVVRVDRLVLALLVGEQEAAEGDHRAGRREL